MSVTMSQCMKDDNPLNCRIAEAFFVYSSSHVQHTNVQQNTVISIKAYGQTNFFIYSSVFLFCEFFKLFYFIFMSLFLVSCFLSTLLCIDLILLKFFIFNSCYFSCFNFYSNLISACDFLTPFSVKL